MEERTTVKELLEESMREKKVSIARLAELTDIPERYIVLFLDDEQKGLPPAPYVRGYLIKIAGALGLEGQQLWQAYKKQQELKTSGMGDRLPANRFAFKRVNRKKIGAIIAIVVLLIVATIIVKKNIGGAAIDIQNPIEDSVVVYESAIDLPGKINPGEYLTINNEDIAIDRNGYFEKNISLEPGINSVEFKVKRLLGKESITVKQIIYQQ